jgi:hypothetical protein
MINITKKWSAASLAVAIAALIYLAYVSFDTDQTTVGFVFTALATFLLIVWVVRSVPNIGTGLLMPFPFVGTKCMIATSIMAALSVAALSCSSDLKSCPTDESIPMMGVTTFILGIALTIPTILGLHRSRDEFINIGIASSVADAHSALRKYEEKSAARQQKNRENETKHNRKWHERLDKYQGGR